MQMAAESKGGGVVGVLRSLINVANEISHITAFNRVLKPQCRDLTRRITFLAPLFHDLLDGGDVISSSVPRDALVSLHQTLLAAKELLLFATQGSQLYMILESERIKHKFNDLAARFEQSMIKLSWDKLDVSLDVKEQVALVTAQFRRTKEHFDPPGFELHDLLVSMFKQGCDVNNAGPAELRLICEKLQIMNAKDLKQELIALRKMVEDKGGCLEKNMQEMSIVLKKIQDFMLMESADCGSSPRTDKLCRKLSSQLPVIPDEFRCPISLELMKDPVIICTGQTYERVCIKKWLDAGHRTCPKTRQILSSSILIPNHVLYNLISNWCEANGMEPPRRLGSLRLCKATSDGASKLLDLDALISKLTSSDNESRRCAAGELRLLAKHNGLNRILIAEAGAIPLLVDLLYVPDTGTQEQAVTAILNLSINVDNKECIMASEAVPGIIHVLNNGSMEARENAAATLFCLSAVDENKVAIGASGAIKPLVTLLCEGSQRGKMDAATALFNLCLYQGNRGRAIRAGIVPKLIEMLTEPCGEMRDEALAIIAIIVSHRAGKAAIGSMNVVLTLVELINNGCPKNKENATSVLVHLCSGDPPLLQIVNSIGVTDSLSVLAENGSERGKRKAVQLLELIGNS